MKLNEDVIKQLIDFAKGLGVGSAEIAIIKTLVELGFDAFETEVKKQWKLGGSILDIDTSKIPRVGRRK